MESFAPDLRYTPRQPLKPEHIDAIRRVGKEVLFSAGDRVADVGEPMDRFFYIEEGRLQLIDPFTHQSYLPDSLGPTQYSGEMALLYGGSHVIPVEAAEPSRVQVVGREALLDLIATIPEMGDIIINTFNARRRRLFEAGDSSLTLIGTEEDKRLRAISSFASRSRVAFRDLAIGSEEANAVARACGAEADKPLVIFGKGQVVDDPTPRKIAGLLGMDLDVQDRQVFDVLIVGGGPAGVAAAVYAGAEGLRAILVDEIAIGGQAGTSSRIENYMGFPTGISGADLLWRGQVQAMKFRTQFAMPRRVQTLTKEDDGLFAARLDDDVVVCARAVIVATGVQYRKLPLDRLEHFEGAGVYYAATPAESRFCRDKPVAVIGGGNSAGQAAMFLSEQASHVHVLIRSGSLAQSMSDYLTSRLEASPTITLHYHTQVSALEGDQYLSGIRLDRANGGEAEYLDTVGLFVMAGAAPNTDWLSALVKLDEKGFVLTGSAAGSDYQFETSQPGLFAVGDVRAGSVKRVASATGEGSVVISRVWQHVREASETSRTP